MTVISRTRETVKALHLSHDSGVIMASMPGHTTHRVQPMDMAFFRPMSSFFTEEIGKWLRANPGRYVARTKVAVIFGYAYGKAASVATAISAFRSIGIWLVNIYAFQDHNFFSVCGEYFGSCLCTASSGRVTRRCESKSSLFTENKKWKYRFASSRGENIASFKSSYCLQYSTNSTGPKCLRRRQN